MSALHSGGGRGGFADSQGAAFQASVFGRVPIRKHEFYSQLRALIGHNGNVIGAVCCGSLQNSYDYVLKYFEDIRFGASGFAWAAELSDGGGAVWRASKDGKLDGMSVGADGAEGRRAAMLEIIADAPRLGEGKTGVRRYRMSESGRDGKVTSAYGYFKPWNMVVGVNAYSADSFEGMARISRSGERFIFSCCRSAR